MLQNRAVLILIAQHPAVVAVCHPHNTRADTHALPAARQHLTQEIMRLRLREGNERLYARRILLLIPQTGVIVVADAVGLASQVHG